MEKLISVAGMRASDAAAIAAGTDSKTLMYRAGLGLFQSCDWHGKIDIVAGNGNNAGDGYVLALLLHRAGIPCRIVHASEKASPDGSYYLKQCREAGIPETSEINFSQTEILVDCLLGTGFRGTLRPGLDRLIRKINASSAFILSVDINSGMHGDTGEGFCIRSDRTVSIGYLKYGHLLGMAQGKIGSLYNYDIGIPCISSFLPILEEEITGEAPEQWDFAPGARYGRILKEAKIPIGKPALRLQLLAKKLEPNLQFFQVQEHE